MARIASNQTTTFNEESITPGQCLMAAAGAGPRYAGSLWPKLHDTAGPLPHAHSADVAAMMRYCYRSVKMRNTSAGVAAERNRVRNSGSRKRRDTAASALTCSAASPGISSRNTVSTGLPSIAVEIDRAGETHKQTEERRQPVKPSVRQRKSGAETGRAELLTRRQRLFDRTRRHAGTAMPPAVRARTSGRACPARLHVQRDTVIGQQVGDVHRRGSLNR